MIIFKAQSQEVFNLDITQWMLYNSMDVVQNGPTLRETYCVKESLIKGEYV